jgi:hypothetical protein
MSAKHTPGPWRVFGYDIGTSPDETLAVVCAMDDNTDDANATLIAAAPDLLAALVELDAWAMNESGADYPNGTFEIVRAALRKAGVA